MPDRGIVFVRAYSIIEAHLLGLLHAKDNCVSSFLVWEKNDAKIITKYNAKSLMHYSYVQMKPAKEILREAFMLG